MAAGVAGQVFIEVVTKDKVDIKDMSKRLGQAGSVAGGTFGRNFSAKASPAVNNISKEIQNAINNATMTFRDPFGSLTNMAAKAGTSAAQSFVNAFNVVTGRWKTFSANKDFVNQNMVNMKNVGGSLVAGNKPFYLMNEREKAAALANSWNFRDHYGTGLGRGLINYDSVRSMPFRQRNWFRQGMDNATWTTGGNWSFRDVMRNNMMMTGSEANPFMYYGRGLGMRLPEWLNRAMSKPTNVGAWAINNAGKFDDFGKKLTTNMQMFSARVNDFLDLAKYRSGFLNSGRNPLQNIPGGPTSLRELFALGRTSSPYDAAIVNTYKNNVKNWSKKVGQNPNFYDVFQQGWNGWRNQWINRDADPKLLAISNMFNKIMNGATNGVNNISGALPGVIAGASSLAVSSTPVVIAAIAAGALTSLTQGLVGIGIGGGMAKNSIQRYAQFEQAANRIQAWSTGDKRITDDDMKKLKDFAKTTAKGLPAVTANQMMAVAEMGQKGGLLGNYDKTGIQPVLDLMNTAGRLTTALAQEGVSPDSVTRDLVNISTMFEIGIDKAEEIANKIMFATTLSPTNWSETMAYLRQAGTLAHGSGKTLEQVLAEMSVEANKTGLTGSQLGVVNRSVNRGIRSKGEIFEEIGVGIYDELGNERDYASILYDTKEKLRERYLDASEAQINNMATLMLNVFAGRAVNIDDPEMMKKFEEKINNMDMGLLQEVSDANTKGLSGIWGKMVSNWDIALTDLGENLAPSVQRIGDFVLDSFKEWLNTLNENYSGLKDWLDSLSEDDVKSIAYEVFNSLDNIIKSGPKLLTAMDGLVTKLPALIELFTKLGDVALSIANLPKNKFFTWGTGAGLLGKGIDMFRSARRAEWGEHKAGIVYEKKPSGLIMPIVDGRRGEGYDPVSGVPTTARLLKGDVKHQNVMAQMPSKDEITGMIQQSLAVNNITQESFKNFESSFRKVYDMEDYVENIQAKIDEIVKREVARQADAQVELAKKEDARKEAEHQKELERIEKERETWQRNVGDKLDSWFASAFPGTISGGAANWDEQQAENERIKRFYKGMDPAEFQTDYENKISAQRAVYDAFLGELGRNSMFGMTPEDYQNGGYLEVNQKIKEEAEAAENEKKVREEKLKDYEKYQLEQAKLVAKERKAQRDFLKAQKESESELEKWKIETQNKFDKAMEESKQVHAEDVAGSLGSLKGVFGNTFHYSTANDYLDAIETYTPGTPLSSKDIFNMQSKYGTVDPQKAAAMQTALNYQELQQRDMEQYAAQMRQDEMWSEYCAAVAQGGNTNEFTINNGAIAFNVQQIPSIEIKNSTVHLMADKVDAFIDDDLKEDIKAIREYCDDQNVPLSI